MMAEIKFKMLTVWCCILLVLNLHQIKGEISIYGELPSLKLDALDCKTNQVTYSRVDTFCSKQQKKVETPLQKITIAEHVDKQTVKAIRCTKTVSESNHMCARWSHMKLLAPPKYAVVSEITPLECKQIHETGIHTDGNTYPMAINTELHYQKIARGSLTLTSDNVFCNGVQAWIGDVLHEQTLTLQDIILSIQEVELEIDYTSRTASDITNRRQLDDSCFSSRMCLSSNESYVKVGNDNPCRLKSVRELKVNEVTVNTDKGKSLMVVSHEHKIALEKRIPINPSLECARSISKYYSTNIDNLLIVYDRDLKIQKLERVQVEGVSIRSEEVANAQYLGLMSVLKAEGFHSLTNDRICSTIASSIDSIEISPFTPNAILKRRGDLILSIKCKVTEVSVILGESSNVRCLEGYLPVVYDGKNVLISYGSHVIYDLEDKNLFPSIDCQKAPYFVTKEGQVIQQTPTIELVNITLTNLGKFVNDLDSNKIDEVEIFTNDGLYNPEDFQQFEDLIHWGRKRKMLENHMIDNFCRESSCLGTDRYNFQKYGSSPKSLVQGVMNWIKTSFLNELQMIGSYTSIIVVFLYATQLLRCMYRKIDNLLHLRFLFKRKGDERQQAPPRNFENRKTYLNPQFQPEHEIIEMSDIPVKHAEQRECNCKICRNEKHDMNAFWPRNTCGRSCCEYHLKGKCNPYEWNLLDPQNLAFDHHDEDQKHKTFENVISIRSSCKCYSCMGVITHPEWRYFTNACGCPRCKNCNIAELEHRKKIGKGMDGIFGNENPEWGNPQEGKM